MKHFALYPQSAAIHWYVITVHTSRGDVDIVP